MPDRLTAEGVRVLLMPVAYFLRLLLRTDEIDEKQQKLLIDQELNTGGQNGEYPGKEHTLVVEETYVDEQDGVLYWVFKPVLNFRGDCTVRVTVESDQSFGSEQARPLRTQLNFEDIHLKHVQNSKIAVEMGTAAPEEVNGNLEKLRNRVDNVLDTDDE